MKTLRHAHRLQLIQIQKHDPAAARHIERLLAAGSVNAAIRRIRQAMHQLLDRLAPHPTTPLAAELDPTDPADFERLPRTVGESIQSLLGQDYEADRRRLASETKVRKPTEAEAQRALEAALKPGGGHYSPIHRPRYQFGERR